MNSNRTSRVESYPNNPKCIFAVTLLALVRMWVKTAECEIFDFFVPLFN